MRLRLLLCALAVLGLGGCSSDSSDDAKPGESAVSLSIGSYQGALDTKNPARACSKLTPEYRRTIAQSDPKLKMLGITDCEEFMKELQSLPRPSNAARYDIEVKGDSATARRSYPERTITLRKSGGEWKIDSIEPVAG